MKKDELILKIEAEMDLRKQMIKAEKRDGQIDCWKHDSGALAGLAEARRIILAMED